MRLDMYPPSDFEWEHLPHIIVTPDMELNSFENNVQVRMICTTSPLTYSDWSNMIAIKLDEPVASTGLVFDDVDDIFTIQNTSSLTAPGYDFTIEGWVRYERSTS